MGEEQLVSPLVQSRGMIPAQAAPVYKVPETQLL
jgi:hypothetical protein